MHPILLQSSLLAHVPHAFTTRIGGVSTGPFASLNFGNPGDLSPALRDPADSIRENWRLVMDRIEGGKPAARRTIEVHQVHGAQVHVVARQQPPHPAPDPRADAIVTDDPLRLAAVRTADCAPVLLATRDGRVVAAVHAGWCGVIGGVAPAAVAAVRRLAGGPCELLAAIGPCIGPASFEVGPEVAAEFHRVFGAATPHVRRGPGGGDRSLVDLKGALAGQLRAAGVTSIDVLPHCTYQQPDLFFSHRRATHEHSPTGRMAAVIGPRA